MKVLRFLVALLLIFGSATASATVRFKQYKQETRKDARVFNKIYLSGSIDGLMSYNAHVLNIGGSPLFCLPGNLALAIEQADDIVMRWAAKQTNSIDELPIGMVLLFGLEDTFPCRKPN